MALDAANRRLFVGCRNPARLVVLDITAGKPVADLAISGDIDDLFYDAERAFIFRAGKASSTPLNNPLLIYTK